MKRWAIVAAFGIAALSAVRAEDNDVGGLTPEEEEEAVNNMTSTKFLDTEYDPKKCLLQFASLGCDSDDDCAYLNGFKLECVNLGRHEGVDKKVCECPVTEEAEEDTDSKICQRKVAPELEGVPQFADCSGGKKCVDSYGHTPPRLESRVCAEKLHCVEEIDSKATEPANICHTCRSCIQQNDNADKLQDKRRFDCTTICPPEILESLKLRNEQGVGIADELKSKTGSKSKAGADDEDADGEKKDDNGKEDDQSGGRRGPRPGSAVTSTLSYGAATLAAVAYAMLS